MAATTRPFRQGDDLPKSIYVDANVVISASARGQHHHGRATAFFRAAISQRAELWVSTLTVDEFVYNLIRLYHAGAGADYDSKIPEHNARFAGQVRTATGFLFSNTPTKLYNAKDPMRITQRALIALDAQRLAPRDSFHLAHTLEAGLEAFATFDRDFDNLALPPDENLVVLKL